MQAGSLNGGVGGEYNGVGFVGIYEMFVAQDDFFQWIRSFA